MNLLPKASGTRPRLACEIAPGGVVAARSPEPGLPLAAVARAALADGAVVPSLKPGNVSDRMAVIAAVRRVLEDAGGRPNARNSDLTLVIPDGAVRVLLLEFDSLPNKLSEALPLVRFRLKKLVPFDADDAMVSFQVMSTSRTLVRALAVAVPRDVLSEYESVAREAGFEPGAVIPSTLAALAGLNEGEGASLVVNAHPTGVTTAIVRAGILLLHRSIELAELAPATPANLPPALFEPSVGVTGALSDPLTGIDVTGDDGARLRRAQAYSSAASEGFYERGEPAAVEQSPYVSPTLSADLNSEVHNAILVAPTSLNTLTDPAAVHDLRPLALYSADDEHEPTVHTLAADTQADEISNAVSVAVAYFEDSLGAAPPVLLSAGPLGADALHRMLSEQGVAQESGVRVRELVDSAALSAGATTASVPRNWLAGVVGALKS